MDPEHTNLADVWGAQQRQTAGAIDALSMVVATAQPQQQQPTCMPFESAYSQCYSRYQRERWGSLLQEEEEQGEDDDCNQESEEDMEQSPWGEPSTSEPQTPRSDDDDTTMPAQRKRQRTAPTNPRPRRRQRCEDYDVWNRGECFLCAWGDKFHDGIEAPHVNKLFSIIDDCLGIWSKLEIARAVVQYYDAVVYDAAQGMPRMTWQMVMDHLDNHTRDARLFVVNRMDEACQIAFMLKQQMVRPDGTFDYKALGEYWRAVDKAYAMYHTAGKLEKMGFNNGKTREDTRLMSNPMQLMRAFTQRRPHIQHQDDVFRISKR